MKTKIKLVIGFVLMFLCVIPVFVSAFTIEPPEPEPEYPTRDIIVVPRLLVFRASLHLQDEEVWIKLWVINLARQNYMFQVGVWLPVWGNSWGLNREQVVLGPHERFTGWLRVRPFEDGGRTTLVPVFIRVYPDDPFWRPWDIVYSGDFTLKIPERWDYTATV